MKVEHGNAFLVGSTVGILDCLGSSMRPRLHGSISFNIHSVLYQRTMKKGKQKRGTVHCTS